MVDVIHTPAYDLVIVSRGFKLSSKLARTIRKNPDKYIIQDENRFSDEEYKNLLDTFLEPSFVKHIHDYLTKEVQGFKDTGELMVATAKVRQQLSTPEHKQQVLKQLDSMIQGQK